MVRERLPDADTEARDGAMEVTHERLEGPPLTGWRATAAAWAERLGGWLGAASSSASPARSSGTTPAPDASIWERRLTARQKLARVASLALAAALVLFAALDGVGAARGVMRALDHALHPPHIQAAFDDGDYKLRGLPPAAQHLPRISLAPELDAAGRLTACWVSPYNNTPDDQRGLAVVARTVDTARDWRREAFPAVEAVDCAVVADSAGTLGKLIIVTPGNVPGNGLCETPRVFSWSEPGRAWMAIPWATADTTAPCDLQFALDSDAIFAWSSAPLLPGVARASATTRLIVTRDNGATWAPADSGLDDLSGLALVGFRAGGRILATVPDVRESPGASRLMESHDYGATWRFLGDTPGVFSTIYASTDPGLGDNWGRLYEIARPLINGAPADSSHIMLATAAQAGGAWSVVPLPPLLAGDTRATPEDDVSIFGIGPAGSLLVERGVVQGGVNAQLSASRRLWAWSAAQGQWLLDMRPTLGDAYFFGAGWSHGNEMFWLASLQLGVPPTLLLYSKTFSAASLGPVSGAGG